MKNIRGTMESLGLFNKNSKAQQLIIGSITGFATGYLVMNVGHKVAFLVGGGVILLQIAQNYALTKFDWEDARAKVKEVTQKIETKDWKTKAKNYALNNSCFSASFVGGFLIGVSYK